MTVHERVRAEVERQADELWRISLLLHDKPELAFEEHLASAELVAALAAAQFEVEHGVAGLSTAFRAHWGTGVPPRVALLLEYDALPGLGHACGHNLIAAAGLGAALAVRHAMPDLAGTLMVVGTPAEEGGGGKVLELKAGVFDGIEAALMFHPGVYDWRYAQLTAQIEVGVRFHGRAAHPTGNPTEGVDALAALVQLFGALAILRARLPLGSHVQGIVTEGGTATNIVPDLAEGRFGVRGLTTTARDELVAQLTECAHGIARATGTTAEVWPASDGYQHVRDNAALSEVFARHVAESGITLAEPAPGVFLGSSDIGDVSNTIPAIHPFVAIADADQSDHTPEFVAAAASPRGRAVMLAAARALADTAVDVLTRPDLLDRAWRDFHAAG
ncbi:amidohydrolase [Kutzneria sp. NPDC051319]|uniref:amidohydrolase n=1 Tax=Kutzneria sp. NPDC051319 TaxID=3155047 RepID=UPI0034299333